MSISRKSYSDKVAPEIRDITLWELPITKLGIKKDESFIWDFEREGENGDFNLKIRWKSLHYGYQDRNEHVWLYASGSRRISASGTPSCFRSIYRRLATR